MKLWGLKYSMLGALPQLIRGSIEVGSRPILGPQKAMSIPSEVKRVTDTIWEVPVSHKEGMRVPAGIYVTEKLMEQMNAGVIDQVANVATLPGILKYSYCMPDAHWGYGFPIGVVAATDAGEVMDPERHDLVVDVKAVTLHEFRVARDKREWNAFVILDI